jgi:HEAT repeat protein
MALRFFCPGCWMEIGEKADRCPHCGYALKDFQGLSYEQKLLLALHHPVRENRMMAIRILGDLASQAAVPALGDLLEQEKDYYVIREIIGSLFKIGGPAAIQRIERLQGHPSKMVRKLVKMVLRGVQPKPTSE